MAKKKKKKNKIYALTTKKQLNYFFENCRNNFHIFAFQNESKSKVEFFKAAKLPCIVTFQAKRCFFKTEDDLKDEGFEINFFHLTQEQYELISKFLKNCFTYKLFIKTQKADTRNKTPETTMDGVFYLSNWMEK